MYLYKTELFFDTTNVIGVPASNTSDVQDFTTNHKAQALEVTGVSTSETSFTIALDYSDFSALVEAQAS